MNRLGNLFGDGNKENCESNVNRGFQIPEYLFKNPTEKHFTKPTFDNNKYDMPSTNPNHFLPNNSIDSLLKKRPLPPQNLNPTNTFDLTGGPEPPAEGNWLLNTLDDSNKRNLANFSSSGKQPSSKLTPFGLSMNSKKFFNKLQSDESKIVKKTSGGNMLDFNPFGGSFPDSNFMNSNSSSDQKNTVNLEVDL